MAHAVQLEGAARHFVQLAGAVEEFKGEVQLGQQIAEVEIEDVFKKVDRRGQERERRRIRSS